MPHLKQQFAYRGVFPVRAADLNCLMFHAHDDVVVWEYLWNGADGYETEMVRTWVSWCRTPGCILDIGAYSGLMSLLAAKAHPQNQVHLLEPMERVMERASVNVKLNGLEKQIRRHTVAASDVAERLRMHLYRDENFLGTGSSITPKTGKKTFGSKEIQTVALDAYLPDLMPTVVKIDIEGHELSCLKGMREMLQRARPKMLIEVWAQNRTEVLTFLSDLGYEVQRVEAEENAVNNYLARPV